MIDLTPFCAQPVDTRSYLHRTHPILDGGIACNGHMVIFADSVAPPVAEGTSALPKGVKEVFEGHVARIRAHAFDGPVRVDSLSLAAYRKCGRCSGAQHVCDKECEDCDGDGEFKHGRHYYSCKQCDGDGRHDVPSTAVDQRACPACLGSGVEQDSVLFGDRDSQGINTIYVHLLQQLPNCEISWSGEREILVRFDGGLGMVMSMQGKPRHIRLAGA